MHVLGQTAGWDASTVVTAILSGLAAIAGAAAILMNRHLQRDQHSWQEKAEEKRRDWEGTQERSRREWQESQLIQTRWDEYKRSLYARFLSQADRLYEVSGDLGQVRADLAEDLVNHMAFVEEHYLENEADRIKAMDDEEERDFWHSMYEKELAWFKQRRSDLSDIESEIKNELAITVGEIDLMAPLAIRANVESLAELSQQAYYGSRHDRQTMRSESRGEFIAAVRNDLQVD